MDKQILESIKDFCAQDQEGITRSDFKSTNLLIQILRESASKESLREKTEELITKQNDVQDIIEEICSVYSTDLDSLLQNPKLYGVELEFMRSNITNTKKKISQTKQYLLKNQKNIEQLNFNSTFNKLIYNRLKAVETQVSRFQLASSYLKSKRYLDCALSIPSGQGKSLLQQNIRHKAGDLKNQLSLAICLQLYKFCFLTGSVVVPTHNTMLQRMKEDRGEWDLHQSVPNMEFHMKLYHKYKLLKEIDLLLYVKSLWRFADFNNKTGEIGVLHDAVQAAFSISRAQKLKEYIYLNVRKAVSNMYLLASIFQIYEWNTTPPPENPSKPKILCTVESFYQQCDFTNPHKLARINQFFVASIALGIIVVRKLILVEMTYHDFKTSEYQLDLKVVLGHILLEVKNSLSDVFFSKKSKNSDSEETPNLLKNFILRQYSEKINASLLVFGFQLQPIKSAFQLAIENLIVVLDVDLSSQRSKIQDLKEFKEGMFHSLLGDFEREFYQNLQAKWIANTQKLLGVIGGRIFSPIFYNEYEDIVFLSPMHKKLGVSHSLKLVPLFVSEDKKEYIKQFVLLCFYSEQLVSYFKLLPLSRLQLHRSLLTLLVSFLSRLSSFCKKSFLQTHDTNIAELQQQRDKKSQQDQQRLVSKYPNILRKTDQVKKLPGNAKRKAINVNAFSVQDDPTLFSQYKVLQRVKVIIRFIEYLMAYFNQTLQDQLKSVEPGEQQDIYEKKLDGFQSINFQENVTHKLRNIGDYCGQDEGSQRQIYLVIFKRMTKLLYLLKFRQKVS